MKLGPFEETAPGEIVTFDTDVPYKFVVSHAEEALSKAGNEQIKIEVCVVNENGDNKNFNDYLVGQQNCAWKLSQFSKSTELYDVYKKSGLGVSDVSGASGMCELHYEEYEGKKYLRIKRYLFDETKDFSVESEKLDDDLPF